MLQQYTPSIFNYNRLDTVRVQVGELAIGHNQPIRVQTMTTTDTMDTAATVAQTIRCIEAGAELVRITAPSKREAENLAQIKKAVRAAGYNTPLIADIHFTPNAAEIAARLIEKVRINPGNYVDKKKFDQIDYTDAEYAAEIDRIRQRFTPLVKICKTYGTAMRIGTNHGSLSDRIMSRYGDTPIGMVESALEFLRMARDENYHQIILSMKSSNPQVMVQAYRLLVTKMQEEFGASYPLHLGVTEAGDGEDGRIKSAIGIGSLLEDGIGDTIRVSLTEDPEFEIPVCKDIVARYTGRRQEPPVAQATTSYPIPAFQYQKRPTVAVANIGGTQVPVVVADLTREITITPQALSAIGYHYDVPTDKWTLKDAAADFVYAGSRPIDFALPGTLKVLIDAAAFDALSNSEKLSGKYWPLYKWSEQFDTSILPNAPHMLVVDAGEATSNNYMDATPVNNHTVIAVYSSAAPALKKVRAFISQLISSQNKQPLILVTESDAPTVDAQLIDFATETGALLLDGMGDGIWLMNTPSQMTHEQASGRTYLEQKNNLQFLNNTSFSILQATRMRISKTEYISCPSCGRTLFDLQETTAKIRAATHHLKGVKIAIMGCIVNGPGEMADADFGYVGSGPGKISLYKNKEIVKRNVDSAVAVDELIQLLKDNQAWVAPPQ